MREEKSGEERRGGERVKTGEGRGGIIDPQVKTYIGLKVKGQEVIDLLDSCPAVEEAPSLVQEGGAAVLRGDLRRRRRGGGQHGFYLEASFSFWSLNQFVLFGDGESLRASLPSVQPDRSNRYSCPRACHSVFGAKLACCHLKTVTRTEGLVSQQDLDLYFSSVDPTVTVSLQVTGFISCLTRFIF